MGKGGSKGGYTTVRALDSMDGQYMWEFDKEAAFAALTGPLN